jgi:3-oxoadipate enol-lactonase
MKIKANGITFHCEIEGPEGAPWLVFSNSLATDLRMWDDQAEALKSRFRILRYDHRGHGATDAPAGRYDFATLIADVVALYDELDISRAHFVGLSMGGMTALGLAEQHPTRVDRVVVSDCTGASTPAGAQQWEERIQVAKTQGMEALVEPTVSRWFSPDTLAGNPPALNKVREMIRTTPVNGFVGCAAALSNFDFRPGLGDIRAQALFVCGTKDVALGGLKQLHASVAGSRLVELEGAGHISNMEQPQQFTAALNDFLPR